MDSETIAEQSPQWDSSLSLADLFDKANFFILRTEDYILANVVYDAHQANEHIMYDEWGLSHDRYGITYAADGSLRADYIGELIQAGKAVVTKDPQVVQRHIWECMNCQPFSAFVQ